MRLVYLAFILLSIAACSSEKIAGNSAETGSPELARIPELTGALVLDDGSPAAFARVHCVPKSFDPHADGELSETFKTDADANGMYVIDSMPPGEYSLEAFHAETGKMLLVQGISVSDTVALNDTLFDSGVAKLYVPEVFAEGDSGVVSVTGTTILRNVIVNGGSIVVDSLPADTLDLVVFMNTESDTTLEFGNLQIVPGDTLVVGTPAPDTLVYDFVASMHAPADADTAYLKYVSDIPLYLRVDSSMFNFDTIIGRDGRWEVTRLSADGATSSKKLPITLFNVDSLSKSFDFYVRVDSMNFDDSLQITFNSSQTSGFALDVFPTSRVYTAVWHFDGGLENIVDGAEKSNFPAVGYGLEEVEGLIGSAAYFNGESYAVVENSASSDTTKHSDLNYGYGEHFGFSLWVRLDDLNSNQTLFCKGSSQYDLRYAPDSGFVLELFHDADTLDTESYKTLYITGTDGITQGEWTYIAFGKNASGLFSMFLNGNKLSLTAEKQAWDGTRDESVDLQIGRMFDGETASQYLKGAIDEFFIGGAIRDDSWNYLTYLNQKGSGTWPLFVSTEISK